MVLANIFVQWSSSKLYLFPNVVKAEFAGIDGNVLTMTLAAGFSLVRKTFNFSFLQFLGDHLWGRLHDISSS